jgi:hypothetical protein
MSNIVLDVDGTLADVGSASQEYVGETNHDGTIPWFLNPDVLAQMRPISLVWRTVRGLWVEMGQGPLVVSTGRRESHREVTWNWLNEQAGRFGLGDAMRNAHVFMRKEDDRRPSALIKEEWLAVMRDRGMKPQIAFEDRHDDAAMYRKHGLLCFQIEDSPAPKEKKSAMPAATHIALEPLPPMSAFGPLA